MAVSDITVLIATNTIIAIIAIIGFVLATLAYIKVNDKTSNLPISLTGDVTGIQSTTSSTQNTNIIQTTVKTNANLKGIVTSVGNVTTIPPGSITNAMLASPSGLSSIEPIIHIYSTPSITPQTYTVPTVNGYLPLYLRIQLIGAGSGGASSDAGTNSSGNGSAGTSSYFGTNTVSPELHCGPGQTSGASHTLTTGAGGAGGTILSATLGSGFSIAGMKGTDGVFGHIVNGAAGTQLSITGVTGGFSPLSGSILGSSAAAGRNAIYGGGGSSAGVSINQTLSGGYDYLIGGAGGSGAYLDFNIPKPFEATYVYFIGTGGGGGQGGDFVGGNGGDGCLIITAYFQ